MASLYCTRCLKDKDVDEFRKRPNRPKGRTSWCKDCLNAKLRATPKDVRRKYTLAHKYRMTPEEYETMYRIQGGVCAFRSCMNDATDIDHDPIEGTVRGLLCSRHNTGLGKLGDSVDGLQEAIEYLRRIR